MTEEVDSEAEVLCVDRKQDMAGEWGDGSEMLGYFMGFAVGRAEE